MLFETRVITDDFIASGCFTGTDFYLIWITSIQQLGNSWEFDKSLIVLHANYNPIYVIFITKFNKSYQPSIFDISQISTFIFQV